MKVESTFDKAFEVASSLTDEELNKTLDAALLAGDWTLVWVIADFMEQRAIPI